jgi:hypothetical protein
MKKSKGTGMPRGKATYGATEMGSEGKKSRYTAGRMSNEMGEYGVEPGPMFETEKDAREAAAEMQREGRGFKMGGMVNVRGQGAARATKGCKIC